MAEHRVRFMAPSVRRRRTRPGNGLTGERTMRFVRTPIALVVGFVALAAAFARAERVETVVPLGVAATSQIAKPGDVVTMGFLVTKGTARKVSFTVKRSGKGSKIVPTVAVFDPDGQAFDIVLNGGKVSKAGAPT